MRILHIVASIESEAAGPSVSVPRLAEAQASLGAQVSIATVGHPNAAHPKRTTVHHQVYQQSLAKIPIISSLALSSSLHSMLAEFPPRFDVVHAHGLWLAPNVYVTAAAKRGAVVAISPRGMLGRAAMQFSARKKKVFWHLFQKRTLVHASFIHATSQEEAQEVKAMGIRRPTIVVPNGVHLPSIRPQTVRQRRTILSLGRIHPKKGLESLVRAWAKIAGCYPDWNVLIAGPDEMGHAAQLKRLSANLEVPRISIEGPLFDKQKLDAYLSAGVFVLPTLNENFAMTVAEALAAETPVISTKGAPWSGLQENGCGLWIDHGPDALASALQTLLNLSDSERCQMGRSGRRWMGRDFTWDAVAASLMDAYQSEFTRR